MTDKTLTAITAAAAGDLTSASLLYGVIGGNSRGVAVSVLTAFLATATLAPAAALTTSQPLTLAQTWNAAGVTFTGLKVNVTSTASAAASLLADLQVAGASVFNVAKTGRVSLSELAHNTSAFVQAFYNGIAGLNFNGGVAMFSDQLTVGSGGVIGFSAAADPSTAIPDAYFRRDAAAVLAQRDGTNAQAFRIYNTWTDASNYERAFLRWSANVLELGSEAAGTGSATRFFNIKAGNNIGLQVGGAGLLTVATGAITVGASTNLLFQVDNAQDLGAAGATRPRTGYFGTSVNVASGTITASKPALDLSQTWNAGGVTFTGAKINITPTASAAASRILDLQATGASVFSVDSGGVITGAGLGILINSSYPMMDSAFSSWQLHQGNGLILGSGRYLAFTNGFVNSGGQDVFLQRDAAAILAQRDGANAQTFRIYNTWTDAANYERAYIGWSTNTLLIGNEGAGTGSTARGIQFQSGNTINFVISGVNRASLNTAALTLGSNNALLFGADNTQDIGANGATRPRTGYFGTSVNVASGTITANAPALDLSQTWNAAGVTFTALKVNVTATASAAGSLLADLQIAGASFFNVSKAGKVTLANNPYIQPNGNSFEFGTAGSGNIASLAIASNVVTLSLFANVDSVISLVGNAGTAKLTTDVAANTLALRNGANAQTFNIYNTWTDASNYEKGFARWNANVFEVGSVAAGTGTARSLNLISAGDSSWSRAGTAYVTLGGPGVGINIGLYPLGASGLVDIGSASQLWRDIYISRDIYTPGGTQAVFRSSAAITSGAGASAGTLANAPAAGNPTKWIPINDNGTTRYIPAW